MKEKGFSYESVYFDDPLIEGRAMDIFIPPLPKHDISLFFIHGGGWTAGTRSRFHRIMRGFNALGYICASSDYRLCKDGITVLDQLTDLRHAYDIFAAQLSGRGRPPRIAAVGTSAGAHLAALISLAAPGECGESLDSNGRFPASEWIKPECAILQAAPVKFEPWEDIFPPAWEHMQKAAGIRYPGNRVAYRRLSPFEYAGPAACPVLFLHADNEHMFPLRHIREFKEKMREAGRHCEIKIYSNAEHGFFYDLTRRVQKEAFSDILEFLRNREQEGPGSRGG